MTWVRKKTLRVQFVSLSINFSGSALISEVNVEITLEGTKNHACRLVDWSLKLSVLNWFKRAPHFFRKLSSIRFCEDASDGFRQF
jgi:hypothetical protein